MAALEHRAVRVAKHWNQHFARERRVEKQARKDRRRDAAEAEPVHDDSASVDEIGLIEDIALPDPTADASRL